MKITYWSDFACPYCYIGETRLKKAIREIPELEDVELELLAFRLDPSAPDHAKGDTQTRFALKYGLSQEEAGRTIQEISDLGRGEGLEFNYAGTKATNTMDAHRLTKLALSQGGPQLAGQVAEKLFAAYFAQNQELTDRQLLMDIGQECGLGADVIAEMLDSDQYRDEVLSDEQMAYRSGVHAVPFFIIGKYGIPGAAETEDLKEAIRTAIREQRQEGE